MTKAFLASCTLLASVAVPAFANPAPEYDDPPNPCYAGCTAWMTTLWQDYQQKGSQLELKPAVYSGECHHLGGGYDPDHTHYAVVMIDRNSAKEFYFSTIFSFFADSNEFASWKLADGRKYMDAYWQDHGKLIRSAKSTRVEIRADDGTPGYTYWMRQNPQSGELYYITYGGSTLESFCSLKKNP